MQVTKEQINSARNANLAEFFMSSAHQCERHGDELHVRGFGGLYINLSNNSWFQFSEQRGGKNPIDCLTDVLGMDFTSAVSALGGSTFVKSYSPHPTLVSPETKAAKTDSVYQNTFAYAKENNETEMFMASHKLNISCQSELTKSAPLYDRSSQNYGNFLNNLSKKYGAERMAFVLSANVIQRQNAEVNSGRNYSFSEQAIRIAKKFEFPESKFTECYFFGNSLGNLGSKELQEMLCDFDKILRQQSREKTNGLEQPENEHEKKRVFAYLIKERGIDPTIVKQLVDKRILYQGTVKYKDKNGNEAYGKGNAVFVQKDSEGNVVGAEIHGTNSFKRFKAIAGTGDENLFRFAIGTPKKVYAFESAIDLLSFKMLANPEKIKDSLLVSMGGLKPNALKKLEEKGLRIYSCVDNDERGKKFNEANNLHPAIKILEQENCKDWNELLKKRLEKVTEKEIDIEKIPSKYLPQKPKIKR